MSRGSYLQSQTLATLEGRPRCERVPGAGREAGKKGRRHWRIDRGHAARHSVGEDVPFGGALGYQMNSPGIIALYNKYLCLPFSAGKSRRSREASKVALCLGETNGFVSKPSIPASDGQIVLRARPEGMTKLSGHFLAVLRPKSQNARIAGR